MTFLVNKQFKCNNIIQVDITRNNQNNEKQLQNENYIYLQGNDLARQILPTSCCMIASKVKRRNQDSLFDLGPSRCT